MLRESAPLSAAEARLISPLRLAYIGDTVWELLVRGRLVCAGQNLRHMHLDAVSSVNAGAQAAALRRMEPLLSPEELDVAHRGRNAHSKHPVPKNQNPSDYRAATALEALVGYLYLSGQEERLLALFAAGAGEEAPCPPSA